MKKQIATGIKAYLECVSFTEDIEDLNLSDEAKERVENDVAEFLNQASSLIEDEDLCKVMYDFWFTRNRHGVGFWDGRYQKTQGEELTKIAHSFGEINYYVGDDGLGYFM